MAGLLRSSTSRKIILNDNFSFYAPDYIETELTKHRGYLMKKAWLNESDFDTILHMLLDKVCLVPFEDLNRSIHAPCTLWSRLISMTLRFLRLAWHFIWMVSGQKTGTFSVRIS